MPVRLSERLLRVADYVPVGTVLADVGTDHAYLPIYLVETERVPFAIATDVASGPYRVALANVKRYRLEDKISVRLGPGLEPIRPGEAATVVISGLGGQTIHAILSASPQTVASVGRFIVQPMNAAHLIRRWMYGKGWSISDETVFRADGRLYELIVFDRPRDGDAGRDSAFTPYAEDEDWLDLAFVFGPNLLACPNRDFYDHVFETTSKWRRVCRELTRSGLPQALQKRDRLENWLKRMESWLAAKGWPHADMTRSTK